MRKHFFLLFIVLVSSTVFAAKGLVLTQKYSATSGSANVTVTWYVTETQCKLKMQFSDKDVNSTTWFIPDLRGSKLLSYNDGPVPAGGQKMFFTVPVQNIKGEIEGSVLERTGETKEISGINCEKLIAKTPGSVTEMWVTKDFKTDFYKFAPFFKNSAELKALSESQIKGVPVSSVTKDNAGNITGSYELISVSSSDIAESEFKVPADYKSVEEASKKKN